MLEPGDTVYVKNVNTRSELQKRLSDIGLVRGTEVKCLFKSPLNDPSAYLVRGAVIAIRQKDSSKVEVSNKKYV